MARFVSKTLLLLVVGIATATSAASQIAKDHIVGTWTLVSAVTDKDGTTSDIFGPNAQGRGGFDANGRYSLIFIAGDLPKFSSNNRAMGTADENKAVIVGSLAHFGTYVVDEVENTFTFQVDRATFPNWESKNFDRAFSITDDVLQYTDPRASAGGFATVTFKRAR